MIAMALALAAAPVGLSPDVVMRGASITDFLSYQDCLRNKATVAGIFNEVPARTVVVSVEPKCEREWQEFRRSMFSGVEPSAEDREWLERYRALAVGSVTTDLVVGRAGSCGTAPGPYRCRALGKHK